MKNPYRTTDYMTAAFLLLQGARFLGLERRSEKSKWFLFTLRRRCEKLVVEYVSGKARVQARLFADSIRRVKDIIFQAERA